MDTVGVYDYSVEFSFKLSERTRTFERSFYNLVSLVSDIGGFNDFVTPIPTFFMLYYAKKMYQAQIYTEIPFKKHRNKKDKNKLQKKFASENDLNQGLSDSDIDCLKDETNYM